MSLAARKKEVCRQIMATLLDPSCATIEPRAIEALLLARLEAAVDEGRRTQLLSILGNLRAIFIDELRSN